MYCVPPPISKKEPDPINKDFITSPNRQFPALILYFFALTEIKPFGKLSTPHEITEINVPFGNQPVIGYSISFPELNNLQEAGYIKKIKGDKIVEYEANTDHPLYEVLRKLHRCHVRDQLLPLWITFLILGAILGLSILYEQQKDNSWNPWKKVNNRGQRGSGTDYYWIKELCLIIAFLCLGTIIFSYYWIPVLIFWNKLHKDNYNKKSLQKKKKELTSKLYKTNISFLNEEANNIEDRYLRDKVVDKEALHFARSAAWIWTVPFALAIIINIIKNINEKIQESLKRPKRLKGQKRLKESNV